MSSKPLGRPTNAARITRAATGSGTITAHMLRSSQNASSSQGRLSTTKETINVSMRDKKKDTCPNTDKGLAPDTAGDINVKLETILIEIRSFKEALAEIQELKEDISRLNARNTLLETENQLLVERVTKLEMKEESRERDDKRQNVVIRGLGGDTEDP